MQWRKSNNCIVQNFISLFPYNIKFKDTFLVLWDTKNTNQMSEFYFQ